MKPLISKIRVGDILLGTKNLRSYLRTCSMLRYFRVLDRRYGPKKNPKSLLYTPGKQDQFIVAVNNHDRFAVWSPNKDVILMFINKSRELFGSSPVMNASIFAQWFVKTQGRSPAVKNWPTYAHYLWASVHMNAWRNSSSQLRISPGRVEHPEDTPFEFAQGMCVDDVDRQTIAHAVKESLTQGSFRNLPNNKNQIPRLFGGGAYGPRLQDLPNLRSKLEDMMRNPRLVSKAKKNKDLDFAFLMNVQENP